MRRSSRILCFLLATTLAPAVAEARGGFHGGGFGGGRPFVATPRTAFRPGLGRGFGPGFRGRGRFGRGYGYGGYGYGLGLLGDGLGGFGPNLPYDGGSPGYGPGPDERPPVFVPVAAPPPPCPMIIAVNGGLRHAARTRVVYGSAPACPR